MKTWHTRTARLRAIRESRELGPNRHGDSDVDLAKARGVFGEARPIAGECTYCAGLPWRRHHDGCRGCGLPFALENIPKPEPRGFSGVALFEDWRFV